MSLAIEGCCTHKNENNLKPKNAKNKKQNKKTRTTQQGLSHRHLTETP